MFLYGAGGKSVKAVDSRVSKLTSLTSLPQCPELYLTGHFAAGKRGESEVREKKRKGRRGMGEPGLLPKYILVTVLKLVDY